MKRSIAVVLAVLVARAACGLGPEDIARELNSDFHRQLYAKTYESMCSRVEPDGFFQESLTGAYAGMFPRTVGGLVSLFLETGELEYCERLLNCALTATRDNDMERLPHVLDRKQTPDPISNGHDLVQPEHRLPLYRLDAGYWGVQTFVAPDKPVRAIEINVKLLNCTGNLVMAVSKDRDGEPIRRVSLDAQEAEKKGRWTRFAFDPPLALTPGERYCFRVTFEGQGKPLWFGLVDAGHRLAGAYAHDANKPANEWLDHPDHATAFAVDSEGLTRSTESNYPVLSDRDEVDGQAHVLLAFAWLALRRGPTPFEDEWYPFVAKILDRSTDWPYILTGGFPADLGLVRNVSLEHSREGRMWDTYDILTQSFVGAALEAMGELAHRRNDYEHEARWHMRLLALRQAVEKHLVRELDGQRVYLEMRLPDSGAGVPFGGMGWLNFGPVAAQWEPLDHQVMRDTVAALRQRAVFDWQGKKPMSLDWNADGTFTRSVIGKGIGWEIDYCRSEREWDRIGEWLDFLKTMHTASIYMESATLDANDRWVAGDPGNGEQCSWWCWAIARLRKDVGLSAQP